MQLLTVAETVCQGSYGKLIQQSGSKDTKLIVTVGNIQKYVQEKLHITNVRFSIDERV